MGSKIGLLPGDKIIAVNGKDVAHFEDLMSSKVLLGGSTLTIVRNGHEQQLKVPPNIYNDLSDYGISEFISVRTRFKVDSVIPNGNAARANLKKGDSIVTINGKPITFFDQLSAQLQLNKDKQVQLGVKRAGALQLVNAQVDEDGKLGFYSEREKNLLTTENFGFFSSLPIGASKAWSTFSDNAKGLGKVFKGEVKATQGICGPGGYRYHVWQSR